MEAEFIQFVKEYLNLRTNQFQYFKEKAKYGRSTTQLEKCKHLESELDKKAKQIIENQKAKQQNLF